jgi:hypothetical protein
MKKRILIFMVGMNLCSFLCAQINYSIGSNVYTCKNEAIETIKPNRELNAQELSAIEYDLFNPNGSYFSLGITTSDIVAAPTSSYNCHAYAWHLTSRNTDRVWINQYDQNNGNNLSKYWDPKVGCFIEVSESFASKIFYYLGDHSAVK